MSSIESTAGRGAALFDPTGPLTPTGNLRRRMAVSRLFDLGAIAAAAAGVAILGIVVFDIAKNGAPVLSWSFVTQNPVGLVGGGIANSIVGTIVLVALAAVIAIPVGVLAALYLSEFAGTDSPTGRVLKVALEVMQGVPTIVTALFAYALIVIPEHAESGFAASVALAIVMLPLIARSAQEVLLLVPRSLREAADALGVTRWRGVLTVVLPSAAGGIATGAILALARAAGETAPILVCDRIFDPTTTQLNPFGHGIPGIPIYIYTISDLAVPNAYAHGWAAAFVLMVVVLLANVGARILLARSRAKMGK